MENSTEKEFQVLEIIDHYQEAVGSGTISQELKQRLGELSEATVGRILRRLDEKGWTRKEGYRGRVLTATGQEMLEKMRGEKRRRMDTDRFLQLTRGQEQEELESILIARRAIEREIARLAAQNASPEDIEKLQAIIDKNLEKIRACRPGAEEDVAFHRLLAQIADNKILEAALDLIREEGQLSPILEYIRRRVGSDVVADHKKVLEAIARHDPAGAEKAMVEHIEGIIGDVRRYWTKMETGGGENGGR